jgi:hypothetical protein
MKYTFSDRNSKKFYLKLETREIPNSQLSTRQPAHVVYGGANLFKADTPQKLGKIALKSLETYAPNFAEFARAMWLKGADTLPIYDEPINDLEQRLTKMRKTVKTGKFRGVVCVDDFIATLKNYSANRLKIFGLILKTATGFAPMRKKTARRFRFR